MRSKESSGGFVIFLGSKQKAESWTEGSFSELTESGFSRAESPDIVVFLRLFFCYSVPHKVAYFLGSKFKVIALELSAVVGLS